MVDIDDYSQIRECDYKGEHYSVRDNGAVMRHPKNPQKPRPLDNQWTFGNKDTLTGYMKTGSHRVHIIVATAFYGEHDSTKDVVDHIDTNRCNNRPENLRWLTRLENALNNPATRKRITYLCGGDIQKFIDNPAILRDLSGTNSDIMWMRTVTAEEAKNAYNRIMQWAISPDTETTGNKQIGEWIFSLVQENTRKQWYSSYHSAGMNNATGSQGLSDDERLFDSLSPLAKQRDWHTPTNFLCCPTTITEHPLQDYCLNLSKGCTFATNQYGDSKVIDFALSKDKTKLIVETTNSDCIKPWAVSEITFEDGFFVHTNRHLYFKREGADKYFLFYQGREDEWTGGDVFDDFA